MELTPNTSESSFRLSPNIHLKKRSKDSVDSGCQNETTPENCENHRKYCNCDITIYNDKINGGKDTLDLNFNYRQSSPSTLSNASSCSTNKYNDRANRESQKYHSVVRNRIRKETLVERSKSFQEQDVKLSSIARFNMARRLNRRNNNFDEEIIDDVILHPNIEITIEDMDADEQMTERDPYSSILKDRTPSDDSAKHSQNECSSVNSSEFHYDRCKIRSDHILGRIFRRMRKLSMAWRRSKNKAKTRGEVLTIRFSLHLTINTTES